MEDSSTITLANARREYLANCTTAMPIGGFIAWAALAIAAYALGDRLPSFAPFVAAAAPVPIALVIDMARGELGYWKRGQENPVSQLFMRFITVVALIIPFAIIASQAANNLDLLILGLAILAGMIWVPHGWGADDPAGFIHFTQNNPMLHCISFHAGRIARRGSSRGSGADVCLRYHCHEKTFFSSIKAILHLFVTVRRFPQ